MKNQKIKNVIEFFGKVLQIRSFDNNHENFGYNATFQSCKRKKIAILGVGYADGLPRILSNNSYAFFKEKNYQLLVQFQWTIQL